MLVAGSESARYARHGMDDRPESHDAPHCDANRWPGVLESIGPDGMLVAIDRQLGDRLRRHITAQDVWQETLHHAWRDRQEHRWRDARSYRAWLLAIAKNRIFDLCDRLDAIKRGGRERVDNLSELLGEGATESQVWPEISTTASRVAVCSERVSIMKRALGSLPPEQQAVVHLHLFEELPMESVAAELDLKTSTAWYRFRRAIEAYAARLREYGITGDSSLA